MTSLCVQRQQGPPLAITHANYAKKLVPGLLFRLISTLPLTLKTYLALLRFEMRVLQVLDAADIALHSTKIESLQFSFFQGNV